MTESARVFVSYSHVDRPWLDRLLVHLRPLELRHGIDVWSDTKIAPGDRWREEIAQALLDTKAAILLISADYLASQFITSDELPTLLRSAASHGTTVLPLIVSHCGFLRHETLREFQAVNDPHEPLNRLHDAEQDGIFEKIAAYLDSVFSKSGPGPLRPPQAGTALNTEFSFESFVTGSSNEFAVAASQAVATSPAYSYNPLFLYSGVGLGKTHLLHAIGNQIKTKKPHQRLVYLNADDFVSLMLQAIRHNRMRDFRERFCTVDILLIDDIQFLAGQERTQMEFFHIFNALYHEKKQIVVASDSSPRNIPLLEERLRSRFEWGLITDIQQPDLETRIAIVQQKATLKGAVIPPGVAKFIAQQATSSVRELEGYVHRVLAFTSRSCSKLSRRVASEALSEILRERRPITPSIIVKAVARHYKVKAGDVTGRSGARRLHLPRDIALYFSYALTDLTMSEIGLLFGGRRASSVAQAVSRVTKKGSEEVATDLRVIESQLARNFAIQGVEKRGALRRWL